MIYLVAPNATHPSGGVGVAAQWVKLLIDNGHEAMFITPNGDPSPYWLNFTVPAGSYADMVDIPENKRVDIWMDCMMEHKTPSMKKYFFAQDVCQLEHIQKERGAQAQGDCLAELRYRYTLITLTHHAHWYYLYRYGIQSKVVNNWVDTDLFKPGNKDPNAVCMINHRDHFSPKISEKLKKAGFTVKIASGSQAEVAQTMAECLFFVSDVRGRWDGYEMSEGMPMPIMEAMASGCVVFCRDTNGVREFIREGGTGFFKTEWDDLWLLDAWRKGAGHYRAHEMSARARTCIALEFSRDRVLTQIQEALELK